MGRREGEEGGKEGGRRERNGRDNDTQDFYDGRLLHVMQHHTHNAHIHTPRTELSCCFVKSTSAFRVSVAAVSVDFSSDSCAMIGGRSEVIVCGSFHLLSLRVVTHVFQFCSNFSYMLVLI